MHPRDGESAEDLEDIFLGDLVGERSDPDGAVSHVAA